MSKKQTYFSELWLTHRTSTTGILKHNVELKAGASYAKNFKLWNLGVSALQSHAKRDSHESKIEESYEINQFFAKTGAKKSSQFTPEQPSTSSDFVSAQ